MTAIAQLQWHKRVGAMWVPACLCILFLAAPAIGAEYFVGKQGNDANAGLSREAAFLTIQKGVDALKPGDTLTIGPGEYLESVKRDNLGGPDADTTIRAEIPGTALLRGDVPLPDFKKVEGYRFVCSAPFDQEPQMVLEHDTLRYVLPVINVAEMEFSPGCFYYDAGAKTLYLSRADLQLPEGRFYTAGVNKGSGLELNSPRRVVIDGLAVTGFANMGILLADPVSCVVRNCVCFMNSSGIVAGDLGAKDNGSKNLVENCVCYGNRVAGVARFGVDSDTIRNCYTYKNGDGSGEQFGVMSYWWMKGPLAIQNCISWGHTFNFSNKPADKELLENCVALGYIRNQHMSHNLVAGGNEGDPRSTATADNILFLREQDLNKDMEFADPSNLDFRLQPGSRFRGTAPDKSDRGPYQYQANIFYVSPLGNDQADGLSIRTPWRTLERGIRGLRGGDTLYLMKGEYAGAILANAAGVEKAINIRGRGRDPVVITGRMAVNGGGGVSFERLNFTGVMSLDGATNVAFKNCAFSGMAEGLTVQSVKGLRVTHSVFANAPLALKNSSGVFLSANLYANAGKPAVQLDSDAAILYSDYNGYRDPAAAWQVAGVALPLAGLQKRHDVYSLVVEPQLSTAAGPVTVSNEIQFAGRGPHGTTLGIYHEYEDSPAGLRLVGPFLHSVSDTTADIEWWGSAPARYSLAWGDTPEMKNTVEAYSGPERFNTFSLTGLKAGQTYYFKIQSADASDRRTAVSVPVLKPEKAQLSFTTARNAAEPRVYYVATNGNDANDGLSREKALRTVNRAADRVGPGDTVLITDGDYNERVRIRAAGTPERPITFRCAPGEKANLRGDNLPRALDIVSKPDNRFDGLYFRERRFWAEGTVVRNSDRVQFTRCFYASILVDRSADVLVRNCVLEGGWMALELSNCPGSVVENNVFILTILRQINADAPAIVRNNIFCECERNKTHQTLLQLSLDSVKESNNCFHLRWPEEEKLAVSNLPLPVYRARTGSDSFVANPMMPGLPGRTWGWPKISNKDFDEFFTANPKLILRGIGLQPEAFKDFTLGVAKWPYDRAWAESVTNAGNAADALAKAGKDAQALAAYTGVTAKMQMCDRLKTDILEKASLCAERMKDYAQAMQLAKSMPVQVLSMRRQMQLMLAQKQYAALLDSFEERKMGGASLGGFMYPELSDVIVDLYYYRSIAYCETGNLDAAEADLKAMNDAWLGQAFRDGDSLRDIVWLRLGDFYRDWRKDDQKALEAYLTVCSRTTIAFWGTPPKAPSTGATQTLVAATKAACEILTKQGKTEEVKKLQADLVKAQADAAAELRP